MLIVFNDLLVMVGFIGIIFGIDCYIGEVFWRKEFIMEYFVIFV